jgi:hypothetical protein
MRRALLAVTATIALALLPASAANAAVHRQTMESPVLCLHVVDTAHLDKYNLKWAEAAIMQQVNSTVWSVWGTPKIRFCNWGWPVYLKKGPGPKMTGDNPIHARVIGYHWYTWRPYAVIYVSKDAPWIGVFDHEVLEMLVDRRGRHFINGIQVEICDPAEGHRYHVWGRRLVDWVTPDWFAQATTAAAHSTDFLGEIHAPQQVLKGGHMPDHERATASTAADTPATKSTSCGPRMLGCY